MMSFTDKINTRSSVDSMWSANVERVHGYFVPESCMQTVRCICRKGFPLYLFTYGHARNMAFSIPNVL